VHWSTCCTPAPQQLDVLSTRAENILSYPLFATAFGRRKWLYTDTDFEPAKAAERTLIHNGMLRVLLSRQLME
jgi:hypothetical protein